MHTSGHYRLGVLASGGGTNLQALLDRGRSGEIPAVVAVVIGNNSGSGALARARAAGVPAVHLSAATHADPADLDRATRDTLDAHRINLVVLAGYMKRIGPETLSAYRNRIVNIHPALLPSFGGPGMYGRRVHEAVLASGARYSGATVHLVREDYDTGPILAQEAVLVLPGDTPEVLAERVLAVEHALLPAVVRAFAEGRVTLGPERATIARV